MVSRRLTSAPLFGLICCLFPGVSLAAQGDPPAAAPAAPAASAPEMPEIPPDGVVRGEIDAGDRLADRRRYEDHRIQLTRGDVVQVDMEAIVDRSSIAVIDSHVSLRPRSMSALLMDRDFQSFFVANDDLADGVINSRIYYLARGTGPYIIRASGGQAAEAARAGDTTSGLTGRYRLTVRKLASATDVHTPLALGGEPVEGEVNDRSRATVYRRRPYRENLYTFTGATGERIRLEMTSSDFASSLQLSEPSGRIIATFDSDSAVGPTARIATILGPPGVYTVRAQAPIAASGQYRLSLVRLPPPAVEPPTPILVGATVSRRLDEATAAAVMEEGTGLSYFFRDYSLRLNAGEVVTVTLTSSDFDPVLEVGVLSILGFAAVLTSDDADGLNSRLVLRPTARGNVQIRVRSVASTGGAYELRVQPGDIPSPEAPAAAD